MPFHRGPVAYARFHAGGNVPEALDTSVIDALRELELRPSDVVAGPEVQAGWVAGRHIYDTEYAPETNVFGDTLLFGMRVDSNRVPAEVRRAYRSMAEQEHARRNPTGVIGRAERLAARDEADHRCREELASGRYRRSKLVPILWNLPRRLILAPVFGEAVAEAMRALFRTTFEGSLDALTSGTAASNVLSARGRSRDYEDLAPTPFTAPPPLAEVAEDDHLSIPWSPIGADAKDFLGNEMLVWLWWNLDRNGGIIQTKDGPIAAVIDRALHSQCAWDATGRLTLTADGPTGLPEAIVSLRGGKWPRKLGLMLSARGQQWSLQLQGDRFLITGGRLPDPDDPPASQREFLEHRVDAIEELDDTLLRLYRAFLEQRTGDSWSTIRGTLREWIAAPSARTRVVEPELVVG